MAIADNIFIIEKNELTLQTIRKTLHDNPDWEGCLIDNVDNLEVALKELSIKDFDIVLIDCETLGQSPLEALIKLRAIQKDAPLVFLNKPGLESTAISCLKHGANYYLIKNPKWEHSLIAVLDSVLEEYKRKRDLKKRLTKLEDEVSRLKTNVQIDPTTQFYSKKHFETLLSREVKRANRHDLNLSCLVLNVEAHEQPTNLTNEAIVERLAMHLKSLARSTDIWGRLDKGRFAALLPHTTKRDAQKALKRINDELDNVKKEIPKNLQIDRQWGLASFSSKTLGSESELLTQATNSLKSY